MRAPWNRPLPSSDASEWVAGDAVDLLGVIRRQLEEGITPPDPDRVLAATAPAPFDTSFVYKRATKLGEAAEKAASSQAGFDTEVLRRQAMQASQQGAERLPQIEAAQERKQAINAAQRFYEERLMPLAYRASGRLETLRYYGFQILLTGADIGNIAAATNNVLGDRLPLAIMQGLGVGVANVSAGQLGAELRERREREKRPERVPADGESFEPWYGQDGGKSTSNLVLGLGGTAAGLTFVGQFALRSVFDGAPIGLVYAAFALVVLLGSFVNAYVHAAFDPATKYKEDLDAEDSALTNTINDLKVPEATAQGLQAQIDTHTQALSDQGAAIGTMALVEAYTIAINYPNVFGTHEHPVGGAGEAAAAHEDEDLRRAERHDGLNGATIDTSDPFAFRSEVV
jgi:hypothetical protein